MNLLEVLGQERVLSSLMIGLWQVFGVDLIVAIRHTLDSMKMQLRKGFSIITNKTLTEIRGLWLKVFTQYLFHNSPSSSLSNSLVNTCTSSE